MKSETPSQSRPLVIPKSQTPAEKLRRHAICMMRELAKQYPKDYQEIGRELVRQNTA